MFQATRPTVATRPTSPEYLVGHVLARAVMMSLLGLPGMTPLMGLVIVLSVEVAFWAYVKSILHVDLGTLTSAPSHPSSAQETVDTVLDTMEKVKDYYPPATFLSRWFRGARPEDIKRGNVVELMAWVGFNKRHNQLTSEEAEFVEASVVKLESRVKAFPEGKTPGVDPCWMNLEELNATHRPVLLWYLALWILQGLGYLLFRGLGLQRLKHGHLVYWYRAQQNRGSERGGDDEALPLLFFHGIGPGLCVYAKMLLPFMRGRTTILFETPHINLAMGSFRPPTRLETLRSIDSICHLHGIKRAVVVGHSFGTIKASWMATYLPERVAQLILLDPVSILLALPDVCYNFFYRRPTMWFEHVLYHLASKELTIANAIRRHFWWYENVLSVEKLQCPLVVLLAGDDEVVPSVAVREYLRRFSASGEGPDVRVLWFEGFSHAQCMFDRRAIQEVVNATLRRN